MSSITIANFITGSKWLPLGVLSIITNLKKAGHEVRFVDFQVSLTNCNVKNFVLPLLDDSEYLGVSSMSMMLPWLFPTLKKIKKEYPQKKIILGGPGISPISAAILDKYAFVDYVIEGEGETAFNCLVKVLDNKKSLDIVPNLVFRDNNSLIKKNKRIREKLNQLKSIDYYFVNFKQYEPIIPIITSRGCPFDCSFCYNKHMWSGRVQIKPMNSIFTEIEALRYKMHTDNVIFVDDLFLISKKHIDNFFQLYKYKNSQFQYSIFGARIDTIDVDILKSLRDTNCAGIAFGIESGSNTILRRINKNLNISNYLDLLLVVKKYIPNVQVSFIIGYPFESIENFYKTIDLAYYLLEHKFIVLLNWLHPQNETAIYKSYCRQLFYIDSFSK